MGYFIRIKNNAYFDILNVIPSYLFKMGNLKKQFYIKKHHSKLKP